MSTPKHRILVLRNPMVSFGYLMFSSGDCYSQQGYKVVACSRELTLEFEQLAHLLCVFMSIISALVLTGVFTSKAAKLRVVCNGIYTHRRAIPPVTGYMSHCCRLSIVPSMISYGGRCIIAAGGSWS